MMTQRRRRHTAEQIVRKLREGEKLLGQGVGLPEVCKHLEITEVTWYRWGHQYGGMKSEDAKRLKGVGAGERPAEEDGRRAGPGY